MWVGNQTSGTEVQFGLKTIQVSNFLLLNFKSNIYHVKKHLRLKNEVNY